MHFATTATLLYRSLGYPARFVSGYSAVVEKTTTLVPDYAAHAWTEIWIDGLGWIPVDVTPAEYRGAGFGDVSQTESAQTSAGVESGASSSASSSSSAESDTSTAASNASSAASVQTSGESGGSESEAVVPQPSSEGTGAWKLVLTGVGALAALLLFFRLRRALAARRRRKAFSQPDTDRAAICAWQYICSLAVYGLTVDAAVYALVQKAAFSRSALTAEEAAHVVDSALTNAARIDASLGFFGKLAFRYVKALY